MVDGSRGLKYLPLGVSDEWMMWLMDCVMELVGAFEVDLTA